MKVVVHPGQRDDGVLTFKHGANAMYLNLKEWVDFFKIHEVLHSQVHKNFHLATDPSDVLFVWQGLKPIRDNLDSDTANQFTKLLNFVLGDKELISIKPFETLLGKLLNEDEEQKPLVDSMVELLLDQKFQSVRIGSTKRIRVRFHGANTQVHLYAYDKNTAVVTLLQLSFDEFTELYKHVSDINALTQNRLYVGDGK